MGVNPRFACYDIRIQPLTIAKGFSVAILKNGRVIDCGMTPSISFVITTDGVVFSFNYEEGKKYIMVTMKAEGHIPLTRACAFREVPNNGLHEWVEESLKEELKYET